MGKMERTAPEKSKKTISRSSRMFTWFLLLLNLADILLVTLLCIWQSHAEYVRRKSEAEQAFLSMVEGVSLFACGDILHQQNEVSKLSRYIDKEIKDVDGALSYLYNVAESSGFHLHLFRTDTLRGWCASTFDLLTEEDSTPPGSR